MSFVWEPVQKMKSSAENRRDTLPEIFIIELTVLLLNLNSADAKPKTTKKLGFKNHEIPSEDTGIGSEDDIVSVAMRREEEIPAHTDAQAYLNRPTIFCYSHLWFRAEIQVVEFILIFLHAEARRRSRSGPIKFTTARIAILQ